ncbi:hypothetical protein [Herbidospora yilanensis]|uniref:hypothetical protein n=1 Tax=Herbidospora yilanensis TaxID=354426 RepID=UPI000781F46F|nr:hypothetical protein [Herbidospora yilanensis]
MCPVERGPRRIDSDDYSVAALGTRASALVTSRDPVIGTGMGTAVRSGVRFDALPPAGRTPFPGVPSGWSGARSQVRLGTASSSAS